MALEDTLRVQDLQPHVVENILAAYVATLHFFTYYAVASKLQQEQRGGALLMWCEQPPLALTLGLLYPHNLGKLVLSELAHFNGSSVASSPSSSLGLAYPAVQCPVLVAVILEPQCE